MGSINGLFFVLGAGDPEMNAIAQGLTNLNANFGFAAIEGTRVNAGQAYKANSVLLPSGSVSYQAQHLAGYDVVLVECGFPQDFWGARYVIRVDHHNPGDPGYGRPPAEFLQASSIGQVIDHMENTWSVINAATAFGGMEFVRLVAAGDHCPGHAYQGKCPGVTRDALMAFRAANQAAFQKLSPEQLEAQVRSACAILESLPRFVMAGVEVADATATEVKSLNEASLILNIPVQYRFADKGRIKVGLLAGEFTEVVREWMSAQAGKLVDIYGDPARGYAGGYEA